MLQQDVNNMIWLFATFILANLIALASPGPAFVALSNNALNNSKREAFIFGLGLATIATFWCFLGFFGLTTVFTYVPWLYTALKFAGGIYLIYLAIKTWRGASLPLKFVKTAANKGAHSFFAGCAINIANPKAALFAGFVLLAVFPVDMAIGYKLLAMAIMFTLEATFYSAVVLWLGQPKMRQTYRDAKKWIDRCTGVVLGALGIKFLLQRA